MASRRIVKTAPEVVAESIVPLDFSGLDELLGYRLRRAQGAVHRRIWCSKQGRDRLLKTESWQVRILKTRCSSWMLSRTAYACGNGPK